MPHEIPRQKVLKLDLACDVDSHSIVGKHISESRIAIVVKLIPRECRCSDLLIAWDWRTGEVVSNFSL